MAGVDNMDSVDNISSPCCSQIERNPGQESTLTLSQKRSRSKSLNSSSGRAKFMKTTTGHIVADRVHHENEATTPVCQLFKTPSLAAGNKPSPGPRLNLVSLQAELRKVEMSMDAKLDALKCDLKSTIAEAVAEAVKSEMTRFQASFKTQLSSLESRVDVLDKSREAMQEDVKKVNERVTALQSSDRPTTSDPKLQELETKTEKILDTVQTQQRFLDTLDAERWSSNIIITGVPESAPNELATRMLYHDRVATTDDEKVRLVLDVIEAADVKISSIHRLGSVPTDPSSKPRPMKLVLEKRSDRPTVLAKAKTLKNAGPTFSSVYVNKDMHPHARKELGRIRKVVREEKAKPENQGRNVTYDSKSRCVLVDDIIVDRYNPSFL